jgi:hypothetical protein
MIENKTFCVVSLSLPNNFTVIVREGEGRIENKTLFVVSLFQSL